MSSDFLRSVKAEIIGPLTAMLEKFNYDYNGVFSGKFSLEIKFDATIHASRVIRLKAEPNFHYRVEIAEHAILQAAYFIRLFEYDRPGLSPMIEYLMAPSFSFNRMNFEEFKAYVTPSMVDRALDRQTYSRSTMEEKTSKSGLERILFGQGEELDAAIPSYMRAALRPDEQLMLLQYLRVTALHEIAHIVLGHPEYVEDRPCFEDSKTLLYMTGRTHYGSVALEVEADRQALYWAIIRDSDWNSGSESIADHGKINLSSAIGAFQLFSYLSDPADNSTFEKLNSSHPPGDLRALLTWDYWCTYSGTIDKNAPHLTAITHNLHRYFLTWAGTLLSTTLIGNVPNRLLPLRMIGRSVYADWRILGLPPLGTDADEICDSFDSGTRFVVTGCSSEYLDAVSEATAFVSKSAGPYRRF